MALRAYAGLSAWVAHLRWRRAESGVETIEWIGMAAAVLALTGGVAWFLSRTGGGGANTIGEQIVTTITTLLENLTKEE